MKDKIFSMTIELQGNIHNTKTKDNNNNLTYFQIERESTLLF